MTKSFQCRDRECANVRQPRKPPLLPWPGGMNHEYGGAEETLQGLIAVDTSLIAFGAKASCVTNSAGSNTNYSPGVLTRRREGIHLTFDRWEFVFYPAKAAAQVDIVLPLQL